MRLGPQVYVDALDHPEVMARWAQKGRGVGHESATHFLGVVAVWHLMACDWACSSCGEDWLESSDLTMRWTKKSSDDTVQHTLRYRSSCGNFVPRSRGKFLLESPKRRFLSDDAITHW
ncbi:unnamed protein product, partial [Scytosiphon promiscuus]